MERPVRHAVARHAWRGGGRQRGGYRSRHAPVLSRRQRRGCGRRHYLGGLDLRILALRLGRRSAHSDPHARRQGARHRRRGHDAEAGHGGVLPRAHTAAGRDYVAAGEGRTEGHGAGGRPDAGAGAGHGGCGTGGAARVRHEIVRGSDAAGNRTGRRHGDRRDARRGHRPQPPLLRPLADLEARLHARGPHAAARRDLPPAGSGAHAALDGGGREESAGRGRLARGRDRRRARLFLSRRYRPPDRRLQPQERGAAALRRYGGVPPAAGRCGDRRPSTASKSTSPASGARDRP